MSNVIQFRDYTKHKPELDPKRDKPANVIVLPMMGDPDAQVWRALAERLRGTLPTETESA